MTSKQAQDVKYEFIPGDELGEHGLTKIRDPLNKYFPVAVVGIGLHMPCCDSVTDFQNVLEEERCVIGPIPKERWMHDDYYTTDPQEKGKYCITQLGFYRKYFYFDPSFFNLSVREACFIDAQQRQIMETTELALQDAGVDTLNVPKDTGVYLGLGIIDMPGTISDNRHLYNGHTVNGMAHTAAANRTSFHYGLEGPSCAVDTACAASMTAIHMGVMSMWNKECSMAIAGATSDVYSPECVIAFSQLGVLSPTGNSAPFDESNNGYVRSEGTGIVILKSIEDAIRDGDHVYCVIRGTTSAHNGYSMSLTLPSAPAQIGLIQRCYEQFGIDMSAIDYVEAHGTGTPVGDPIEVSALGKTFGASRPKGQPLRIASAKSNFGHLEVCAGMVQVIKVAIMLEQRKYFKHINWTTPNHRMNLEDANITMQLKEEYNMKPENMIIGVNTFGFTGSLVHQIFEEFRLKHGECHPKCLAGWSFGDSSAQGRLIAIPFSARSHSSLITHMKEWLKWSSCEDAQQIASWMATRRTSFKENRLVILADSAKDFKSKVQLWLDGTATSGVIHSDNGLKELLPAEACFVFTGWGQQWFGMGRQLYAVEEIFRKVVDSCDEIFQKISGYSALQKFHLFRERTSSPDANVLNEEACKPAILFMQIGLAAQLKYWGVDAVSFLGVGLGELSAAYASGALTLDETVELMHIRMSAPPKDEFIKAVDKVMKDKKCSSELFYSSLSTKKHIDSLDSSYWWRNVTEKDNVPKTVENVLLEHPQTMFIEVASDALLEPTLQETLRKQHNKKGIVSCGRKGTDDRLELLSAISWLHVNGFQLNWKNISLDCAKHAQLPIYSFDDEEIWLESENYKMRRSGMQDRSYKAQNGRVNVMMHPIITSYHLDDKQLFPASALVEYFAEHDDSPYCFITDIKIHNLTEVPEPDNIQRCRSIVVDMEKNGANMKAMHDEKCLAEARLNKGNEFEKQPSIKIADIKAKSTWSINGEDIRRKFDDLGLTYGLHHTSLEEVYVGDGESIALCCQPHPLGRRERIETVVLESAFQMAIGVFTRGDSLYLPAEIQQLQMFVTKVPSHTPYAVHASLNSWSLKSINCDLKITDQDGNVWVFIKGFEARSRAEFTSDVDLRSCVYTPKWQSCQAKFAAAQEPQWVDENEKVKIRNATCHLNSLIGNVCKSSISKVDTQDDMMKFLKDLASSGDVMINEHDGLGTEEKAVILMKDNLLNHSYGSPLPTEPLKVVLRESPFIETYIKQIVSFIRHAVEQSLENKHVVRICEVGSSFGSLTKQVLILMRDLFVDSRVHYTYLSKTMEDCEDIDEYMLELPKISYEVITDESLLKLRNSFDMVIQFDPAGHLENLSLMSDLLINGGWFVGARGAGDCKLLQFLTGPCSSEEIQTLMTKASLQDVKIYGSSDDWLSFGVGIKTTKEKPEVSQWVFVDNVEKKIAQHLSDLIPTPVQVIPMSDLTNLLNSATEDNINVIIGLEGVDAWMTVHNLVEVILGTECNSKISIWVLNSSTSEPDASAAAALLSSANLNVVRLRSIAVDPKCNDADVASLIFKTITSGGSGESVVKICDGNIQVPRLTRLPIVSDKLSKLKVGEVQVHKQACSHIFNDKHGFNICAGLVVSCGNDVTDYKVGDQVFGFTKSDDPFVVLSSSELHKFPEGLNWQEAVDSIKDFTLAYLCLVRKARVKSGDNVLFTSLESSLGMAAVLLANMSGARVFVTDPHAEIPEFIREMKDVYVVNHESLSFREDILSHSNGKGISVLISTQDDCIPDVLTSNLAVKARICHLGVDVASGVTAPNVRQMVVNYSVYLNTARGKEELHSAASTVAYYLDTGKLQHLKLQQVTDTDAAEPDVTGIGQVRLDGNATYVVVGGLGKLGLQVARWLDERGAKHVALVSRRSTLNDFDKAALKHLDEKGCKVHLILVEIKAEKDVACIFSELRAAGAPVVKGIFNLLGTSNDWLDGSADNVSETLACQGMVLSLIDKGTRKMNLDLFVVFTSCLSMLARSKFAAPVVNTGYINGVIEERRRAGVPGLSYQIGLVRGVGSVSESPDVIRTMQELGMKSLHFDEYLNVLGNLLQRHDLPGVVAVVNQDWGQVVEDVGDNLWMRHLLAEGVRKESSGGMSKTEQCELMVKEQIAVLTGCVLESIDSTLPMQAYGVDSLMSQEVIAWAEKKLKVMLKQADVFDGLTVAQLVTMAM